MITNDGAPKILDFGLAHLALTQVAGDEATRGSTELDHGAIAGTAAYMSPEQAEGKKLEARSDIFSFGAVLYEMVTGRRAFHGDSTASTLAAVLQHEPEPPTRITPQVPRELERIIQRCLRKDPSRRFQHMSDLKVELEEVREESESGSRTPAETPAQVSRRAWIYTAALITLLGIAAGIWRRQVSAPPPAPSQPVPLTSYVGDEIYPDFSQDGSQVVFAWNGENRGKFHIYIKPVGSAKYMQLTKGDAEEFYPKWAPDGQRIAFLREDSAGQHTFLMSPIGGDERKLSDGICRGLSWSSDSKALACGAESGLFLISAETGEIRQLASLPSGQFDAFPAFSPDGRKLLFVRGIQTADCDLYLLELNADLSPRGNLRRITTERASALNLGGLAWTADGREAIWAMSKASPYAMTLYRVPVFANGVIQPIPFVGQGVVNHHPAIARHRNRLAYARRSLDIHIWRADGRTAERHPVSSTELDSQPEFSPDGKRITFNSTRSGPQEIWVASSDGTEPVQLTHFGRHCGSPRWSQDGRWIVFETYTDNGVWDIWVVASVGGQPRRVANGQGSSTTPSFSHDGRWIYFGNNRTGRSEIFRVPLAGGAAWQITHFGGAIPLESVDGQTIYYLDKFGFYAALYEVPIAGGQERPLGIDVVGRAFQVMPDGIYFITRVRKDGSGREIRFYDFATRRSRLIQALGNVNTSYGFAVSADRRSFLYSVVQNNGNDLMLVENFR